MVTDAIGRYQTRAPCVGSAAVIAATAKCEIDVEVVAMSIIGLRAKDGAKDATCRTMSAAQECSPVNG